MPRKPRGRPSSRFAIRLRVWAGIPGIFANPITAAYNLAKQGSNAAFGTDFQRTKLPTEAVSSMLTSAGLPEPETAAERVSGDISRGIAGGGGFAGGAKKLGDLGVAWVNVLAANPAMQDGIRWFCRCRWRYHARDGWRPCGATAGKSGGRIHAGRVGSIGDESAGTSDASARSGSTAGCHASGRGDQSTAGSDHARS